MVSGCVGDVSVGCGVGCGGDSPSSSVLQSLPLLSVWGRGRTHGTSVKTKVWVLLSP